MPLKRRELKFFTAFSAGFYFGNLCQTRIMLNPMSLKRVHSLTLPLLFRRMGGGEDMVYERKLTSKKFMYDEVKYIQDENIEPDIQWFNDYEELPIKDLIEIIDIGDKDQSRVAKLLLIKKLGLVNLDRLQYVLDEVIGELTEINRKLNEHISNFKNHRHDARKAYTEKPAW